MKWTTEKPTVEGWYFWRRSGKVGDHMQWVSCFYETDTADIWISNIQVHPFTRGEWAGPIPEPNE